MISTQADVNPPEFSNGVISGSAGSEELGPVTPLNRSQTIGAFTNYPKPSARGPGPLLPSVLTAARIIEDLGHISYPEGIKSPKAELNVNAKNGKFRYDRDFLLQFMSICKEKPASLNALGLELSDSFVSTPTSSSKVDKTDIRNLFSSGGGGRKITIRSPDGTELNLENLTSKRQQSPAPQPPSMLSGTSNAFQSAENMTSVIRMEPAGEGGKPTEAQTSKHTRKGKNGKASKGKGEEDMLKKEKDKVWLDKKEEERGTNKGKEEKELGSDSRLHVYSRQASIRSDSRPLDGSDGTGDPPQMSGMPNPHPGPHLHQEPPSGMPPQPVLVPGCPIYYHPPPTQQGTQSQLIAPLERSQNAWVPASIFGTLVVDSDSPDLVDKKVKGLLNKLTIENFDSVSDQIIAWANKSEMETDGRTLAQVIRLVFEKAVNEALWSEMYARLCKKIMQQISPKVQDDGIKNNNGKPTAGGQLFRKYLLNRCQENFERVWVAKEDVEDQAAKAANKSKDGENEEEILLHSDKYYAAQKAKRQGLGLIKFIGELFKLQMLTERIMHECVKKLLGNIENPEEEEIESLCTLLTTVGLILDTPKARAHMDVYFSRMKELTKNVLVRLSRRLMLQEVIDLRTRKWVPHNLDRDGWTVSGVPCPPIKAGVTKAGR